MGSADNGVVVPADAAGQRSSSALGRGVVADALREVDSAAAMAAERETDWRRGYLSHFRRLLTASLPSRQAALTIAEDGLRAIHRRMRYLDPVGRETVLADAPFEITGTPLSTAQIIGTGVPETDFSLPWHGERLSGAALARQLDSWTAAGALEPSAADQIRIVMAHPEWLRLTGRTVVILGASAEMGPLNALLRWGARVAAIDLQRPDLWQLTLAAGRAGAGQLLVPVRRAEAGAGDPDSVADHAGLDVIANMGAAAEWIGGLEGALVLGNYLYADGVRNLRLCAAADALTAKVQGTRPELALAFLATPTDVFAVPSEAATTALRAYRNRSPVARLIGAPLHAASAGRLFRRPYEPGDEPAVHDALVRQQGPNYALSKRLQRWRATAARAGGATVSMNIAPPTRTRSVLKNRALAAAYAGAHHFGVQTFEPSTANTLMAALLVADLHTGGGPAHDHPWQDEAYAAVHGGLWRCPYQPRSVLPLAAILGYRSAKAPGSPSTFP